MEDSFFGVYPEPNAAQLDGFSAFEFSTIVKSPMTPYDGKDRFVNKIGMYTAETIQSGNVYRLWLEYEPTFLL